MLVIFASGLGFSCGFNIDQDYVNEFHFVVLLWNSNAKKMQHVQRTQHNQWPGKGLYVIKWQTKINKQNEKNWEKIQKIFHRANGPKSSKKTMKYSYFFFIENKFYVATTCITVITGQCPVLCGFATWTLRTVCYFHFQSEKWVSTFGLGHKFSSVFHLDAKIRSDYVCSRLKSAQI